jgi:DNA-binding HxlR family transcriptional regulator
VARSYKQEYCPIAHALDTVGERWSLLVIRELVHGPLRYTDLIDRLEGCGTNILAARLRSLEEDGIVRRRKLPPPAASNVYELTDAGAELRPVLHALCNWGLRNLGPPRPDAELVPGWLERALRTLAGCADPSLKVTVNCGGETASIVGGDATVGPIDDVQAVIEGDPPGFYHLLVNGDLSGVEIEGDPAAVTQLVEAFAVPQTHPRPAAV